jgi:hypothetical protein
VPGEAESIDARAEEFHILRIMKPIVLTLLMLIHFQCYADDPEDLKSWLSPESSFGQAIQRVWGIRFYELDEIRCFNNDFFDELRKYGLTNVDSFLKKLDSAGIKLNSHELNQLSSLDAFDVFTLYRAHVRTLEDYLKRDERLIAYSLRLTPAQAKAVSFERRLVVFHQKTGLERRLFAPAERNILKKASPMGYTSLARATLMSCGFVVPSLSVLACLSPDELSALPHLGKIRVGEFQKAIDEYRLHHDPSEMSAYQSLRGEDLMIMAMAGVTTRAVYESLDDEALKGLLGTSKERWDQIESERQQLRAYRSCSNQMS